jgi:transposase
LTPITPVSLSLQAITSLPQALRIYRAKDIVEKGLDRLKNSLNLDRLRPHSDTAMQSKYFIGFVALVMMTRIHNTMLDKGLYKTMTMKEPLRSLSKLRVQKIAGERIEFPKSKTVRQILDAFNLPC